MTSTLEALQVLYVVLGGDITDTYEDIANGAPVSDYVVIPDVINAISKHVASGGAAELPAVSSKDDGKVLKVVDGHWALGTDLTE